MPPRAATCGQQTRATACFAHAHERARRSISRARAVPGGTDNAFTLSYREAGIPSRIASPHRHTYLTHKNCLREERLSSDTRSPTLAPLQVLFSKTFDRTLRHALSMAEAQERDAVTPEHLLLALSDDPDAADVMQSCGTDLDALRKALAACLRTPAAAPDTRFYDIIRRAAELIQDTLELEVSGAHILVALLGDPAAGILQDHGMRPSDAIIRIKGTLRHRAAVRSPAATAPAGGAKLAEVKILNDDATPADFVVAVLERVFAMDRFVATRCMMEAHTHGTGTCGAFPRKIAADKAAHVLELARAHGHPLQCVVA